MNASDWSAPERAVLERARDLLDSDRRGVLATIVDVEGSAYRRPGAKMVVPEDGGGVGHITAGCLESEVADLAREVLDAGEPRIETYDLTPEADDDVWGLGVGCNGVIDVLLEPLDEGYRPVLEAAAAGEDVAVLTVLGAAGDDGDGTDGPEADDSDIPSLGARAFYDPETDAVDAGDDFPSSLATSLRAVAADALAEDTATTAVVDGVEAFVDPVCAPPDLLVFGSGHDLGPVVETASRAGFRVTVVTFRGAAADADRFPGADRVVSTSPARIGETVALDADTYAVVATHNFVDDRLTVETLLDSPVPYVGLMGPHERFAEMREEFAEEGRTFSAAELDRLYTPVGLDLGEGSPNGIAVGVVAEALAVKNDREPTHLREREGTIHDRKAPTTDGGSDGGRSDAGRE